MEADRESLKLRLVPEVEATAERLARALRTRHERGDEQPSLSQATLARRLLEELGVHCDESAALQDLKGFLMTSAHGTEIVTRRDLTDAERAEVYAHLVAHALLGPDLQGLAPTAKFEYTAGRAPGGRPAHEVQEERMADAVARAILEGRLEAAPRLVYCRDLGPGRGPLRYAVMQGVHRGSLALYRRSRKYQQLRSLPLVTAFTSRVHSFLGRSA